MTVICFYRKNKEASEPIVVVKTIIPKRIYNYNQYVYNYCISISVYLSVSIYLYIQEKETAKEDCAVFLSLLHKATPAYYGRCITS